MDGCILVTGGAGFVGSHVVDALLDGGHEVRVLDLLLGAAHRERPDYLDPRAELIEGDVRDGETVARARRGRRRRLPPGGDGRARRRHRRHRRLRRPQRPRHGGAAARARRARLRRRGSCSASSMVVYGEGRYALPGARHRAARARGAAADLDAGRFEPPCPFCGRALVPETVPEDAPLDPRNVYAATKLAQEHLCAAYSRETGVAGHRAALPQRLRAADAARHALRRRGEHLPLRLRGRPRAARVRGRRPAARLRPRARRRRAPTSSRSPRPSRSRARSTSPAARRAPCSTWRRRSSRAFGDEHPPEVTGEWRAGDVRHVFASRRARRRAARLPRAGGLRRRDARVRLGPAAGLSHARRRRRPHRVDRVRPRAAAARSAARSPTRPSSGRRRPAARRSPRSRRCGSAPRSTSSPRSATTSAAAAPARATWSSACSVHAVTRGPQRRGWVFLDDSGERTITILGERHRPHRRRSAAVGAAARRRRRVLHRRRRRRAARRARRAPRRRDAARRRRRCARASSSTCSCGPRSIPASATPARTSIRRRGGSSPPRAATAAPGPAPRTSSGSWHTVELPGPRRDAYGAGDSFAGALTWALGDGRKLDDALHVAARAGAAKMTGRAGYDGQLTADAALDELARDRVGHQPAAHRQHRAALGQRVGLEQPALRELVRGGELAVAQGDAVRRCGRRASPSPAAAPRRRGARARGRREAGGERVAPGLRAQPVPPAHAADVRVRAGADAPPVVAAPVALVVPAAGLRRRAPSWPARTRRTRRRAGARPRGRSGAPSRRRRGPPRRRGAPAR